MSRAYRMTIFVDHIEQDDEESYTLARDAVKENWPIEGATRYVDSVVFYGEDDQLCGGETEEDFADRIAKDIWKALGRYCEVTVDATYLEELPFETHTRDGNDYERLIKEG